MRLLFLMLALFADVSDAASAVSLNADQAQQSIQAHMEVYVDTTARLDARSVREIDDFRPLPSEHVNVGFSTAAYWVRLRVRNSGTLPVQKYLQVLNPRLEEVELFTSDGSGTFEHLRAGIRQPFSARVLPYRTSTFPLSVAPGEEKTLLVRIAGRTAITLAMTLWDPLSFTLADSRQLMGDSVILGMMALLAMLCIGLAMATREWAYLYLSASLVCEIVYEAGMRGTLFALYWGDHPELTVRAIGFSAMPLAQFVRLAMCRMLRTAERHPILHRTLLIISAAPLFGAVLCIAGDYYVGTQFIVLGNVPLVVFLVLAAWCAWRQQNPLSAPWLFGFGSAGLGFAPRLTQLIGLAPISAATTYAPSLGVLLGSLIVIVSPFSQLQRDRTKRAIELEKLVRERTQDLDNALHRAEASDAAKGRLMGYIGHDLREPLASLVGLTRKLTPDNNFERDRRAIERSCLLSLEMIDELQQFARDPKASGAFEVVDAPVYLFGLLQEIKEGTEALAQA
ncbi:MAG: 7TM-DISM domain-containing protein, partial [Variovorax sp.]